MKLLLKKIYLSIFCQNSRFKFIGKNTTIKCPKNISNPQCISIGNNTTIYKNTTLYPIISHAGLHHSPLIEIGDNVHIGTGVIIAPVEKIYIGDGCVVSDNVFMCDTEHGFDPNAGLIIKQPYIKSKPIIIEHDTFIGRNVFVAPGVELGNNCVVGANSVVTKSFPSYSMIGGVPAKLIKTYSFEKNDWIKVC